MINRTHNALWRQDTTLLHSMRGKRQNKMHTPTIVTTAATTVTAALITIRSNKKTKTARDTLLMPLTAQRDSDDKGQATLTHKFFMVNIFHPKWNYGCTFNRSFCRRLCEMQPKRNDTHDEHIYVQYLTRFHSMVNKSYSTCVTCRLVLSHYMKYDPDKKKQIHTLSTKDEFLNQIYLLFVFALNLYSQSHIICITAVRFFATTFSTSIDIKVNKFILYNFVCLLKNTTIRTHTIFVRLVFF